MLANVLSRYWWLTLLRGVIWVLFGFVVFTQPLISLVTLTLLFGIFAFIDGVGNVVSAIGGRQENQTWWVLLLAGLAGIGIGILTFLMPGITALALLVFIATWAILVGVFEIVAAIRLRKEIEGEFWLLLSGLLSVLFGVFLLVRPGAGALSVAWLIAAYAIVFGVTLIFLAFKTRGFVNRVAAAVRG
jgi:uncharacterized membrane protein HdeD (DUF308 family)